MQKHHDVIVIGSGVGGGTVARRLAENGVNVLVLERGDWVTREDDNWSVASVFHQKKYTAHDSWLDGTGHEFRPNIYYNVGGCTKFYGGSMIRFREEDFGVLEHEEGVSPAWPISYSDIEPYYCEAESIFDVHGDDSGDPSAPWRSQPYPSPKLVSEPLVQRMADTMRQLGASTSALPEAIDFGPKGRCIRCKTCDGFPCKLGAKNDAETSLITPALQTGRVEIATHCYVQRLLLSADGKRVDGVEVTRNGRNEVLRAGVVVVACGAINSAALLLRSATDTAPQGVANRSGVVGRNYMAHNQTALMGLSFETNDTVFQKTLALNQYYFGDGNYRFPLGHAQMLGKLQGGMLSANVPFLPKAVGSTMARHSMDWIAFSEDLPDPENRIVLRDGKIQLAIKRNNLKPHHRLVDKLTSLLKKSGYPIVLVKPLIRHSTSHQCGTVKFGVDPTTSAIDPYCRSHEHENLFVVDASFMPSSAAVNPALTIVAQALRAADHMLKEDFRTFSQHAA
ncbi:GMC family oxidoreductase [Paraburkholderia sp. Ac-20340]|uniref:GMC family oxidoreductase n=1 Tax=Paraburkholderia sp. Ac-20340 TaxID=2703888 RepID=UPI00197DDAC8|nr:GMC family oxidoreductase [Paraburkholderia sp. Ac-20340]MBN3854027.1 GMC family oxidoreductase [Paraburkholderia sp. Ac-20340]